MEFSSPQNNRLVLGTAQFGMPYGIANISGQPDYHAVEAIIAKAWDCGIHEFDTAQAYGNSEMVLGKVLREMGLIHKAIIVSKFHPDIDFRQPENLLHALEQTLERLGIEKLYGMMLHSEKQLAHWDTGLGEMFQELIDRGLVEKVGVSVYKPSMARLALEKRNIDLLQVPSNILDQRFQSMGTFDEAQKWGKSVYVRSIFLQGLLLMNVSELPLSMAFAKPILLKLHRFAHKMKLSLQHLSVGYAKYFSKNHKVIFGCESVQQVKENYELWQTELSHEVIREINAIFKSVPEKILNPSMW